MKVESLYFDNENMVYNFKGKTVCGQEVAVEVETSNSSRTWGRVRCYLGGVILFTAPLKDIQGYSFTKDERDNQLVDYCNHVIYTRCLKGDEQNE